MSMFYVSTNVSHQAGDGSTESYVTLPIAARLNSVRLCPNVAVTADNTNYVTFKVIDNGATDIFSQNTQISGGGSLVAGTPVSVTLAGAADYDFAAGEVVRLRVADSAAGASCSFTVVYEFAAARSY
jgi:hypothetical protein